MEVLLAHQGGPFWVKKDLGHWTIPKGEVEPGEELVAVARREFEEETGSEAARRSAGRARRDHPEVGQARGGLGGRGRPRPGDGAFSNTFDLEWPPRSGVVQSFPEIDRVEWFELDEARRRLKAAQVPFLDRLESALADASPPSR